MKNNYFLCGLLMSLIFIDSLNAQDDKKIDFTIQGGYNLMKNIETKGGEKFDTKQGIPAIFLESHYYFFRKNETLKNLGIGIGLGFYNINSEDRDIGWLFSYSGNQKASLYWVPLCLSIKYNLPVDESFIPYFKLDNGNAFFFASENVLKPGDRSGYYNYWGGYYLSLSGGILVAKFLTFELSYSMFNSGFSTKSGSAGYWSYSEENYKVKILTISAGVCF
jgi:hypothetical protein